MIISLVFDDRSTKHLFVPITDIRKHYMSQLLDMILTQCASVICQSTEGLVYASLLCMWVRLYLTPC